MLNCGGWGAGAVGDRAGKALFLVSLRCNAICCRYRGTYTECPSQRTPPRTDFRSSIAPQQEDCQCRKVAPLEIPRRESSENASRGVESLFVCGAIELNCRIRPRGCATTRTTYCGIVEVIVYFEVHVYPSPSRFLEGPRSCFNREAPTADRTGLTLREFSSRRNDFFKTHRFWDCHVSLSFGGDGTVGEPAESWF